MNTKEETTPITKEEFLEHVKCGWKRTDFTTRTFWRGKKPSKTGKRRSVSEESDYMDNLLIVGASCAIGAAALSQKMTPTNYIEKYIPSNSSNPSNPFNPFNGSSSLVTQIYHANDGSRSKKSAIEKINAIEWPTLKK